MKVSYKLFPNLALVFRVFTSQRAFDQRQSVSQSATQGERERVWGRCEGEMRERERESVPIRQINLSEAMEGRSFGVLGIPIPPNATMISYLLVEQGRVDVGWEDLGW